MEKKRKVFWYKSTKKITVVRLKTRDEHIVYIILGNDNFLALDEVDKQLERCIFQNEPEARETKTKLAKLLLKSGFHYMGGSFAGRLPGGINKFTSYFTRD